MLIIFLHIKKSNEQIENIIYKLCIIIYNNKLVEVFFLLKFRENLLFVMLRSINK